MSISCYSSHSLGFWIGFRILVSSAKIYVVHLNMDERMSFTYTRNKSGPKILTCGTPKIMAIYTFN